MTNEEIRARMWEAYKKGKDIERLGITFSFIGLEELRVEFDNFIAEEFLELLEDNNPYIYIPVSQAIKSNEELCEEYPIQDFIWPSRRWKETTEGMTYIDLSGY
jgi:hypothetical protein